MTEEELLPYWTEEYQAHYWEVWRQHMGYSG